MIRVIFLFVLLFAVFWGAIQGFQYMTGKKALALTKIAGYSIISASLALIVMFGLVILF
jgi:hypothetical protein